MEEFYFIYYQENKTLRIRTQWETHTIAMHILEESLAWYALITEDHLKTLSEQHELEYQVYLNNLKKYLCENNNDILIEIKNDQFVLYRTVGDSMTRFKYFFVNIEKMDFYNTSIILLDEFYMKYKQILQKFNQLDIEKNKADNQKETYKTKLEDFVELKQKSDLEMYSAFILILNEKKYKIQHLTELLKEYQSGRKQETGVNVPKYKGISTKTLEVVSDSESTSDDEYNTDDEKKLKLKQSVAGPSTLKDSLDFLGDDSPPPSALPKRLKIDIVKESSNISLIKNANITTEPSTSSCNFEDEDMGKSDDTLSLGYDSQDLLDRM